MRKSLRNPALVLVAIACLLVPMLLTAADSNANTAEPTSAAVAAPTPGGASIGPALNPSLVDLLVKKGILTSTEANSLRSTSGTAGMQQLLLLLKAKGVVNDSEVAELKTAADAEASHAVIDAESDSMQSASLTSQSTQPKPPAPTGPTVIPAIAPVRVLSLDPPAKDNLAGGFRLGSGARMMPYGFIKATEAYDSLDPTGDDFPRPGFTAADTGPNKNPEWHMKARSSRIGTKFEWPDISKNITVTGQIEADFEGNFSRADNRNVSSIRSNAFQLRLAYGRIDWAKNPNTDIFFEAGQDWTIFGSSALMNLFETTFYGAYWGNVYERSPQMRLGLVQKLGGSRDWKLSPEFAIMMPSEGDLPADSTTCTITALDKATTCTVVDGTGNQLGYGERQGADSAKPELESRVVLQFQLDKAPGVVPAQILWSGFYSGRQATILASAVPAAYKADFPDGANINSNGYDNQIAISFPLAGRRWSPAATWDLTCEPSSVARPCPTTTSRTG